MAGEEPSVSAVIITRESELRATMDLAETYRRRGLIEVIVQVGPTGPAHARNAGAQRCRGDVLLFLDNDVSIVGDLHRAFELADHREMYWAPERWEDRTGDGWTRVACESLSAMAVSGQSGGLIGAFTAVRTWVFRAVGGYRHVVREDTDLATRLAGAGYRMGTLPVVAEVRRAFSPNHRGKARREAEDLRLNAQEGAERAYAAPFFRLEG